MENWLKWTLVSVGLTATVAVISIVYFNELKEREAENGIVTVEVEPIEWPEDPWEWDYYGTVPPEPRYEEEDTLVCSQKVDEMYRRANNSVSSRNQTEQQIREDMRKILKRQEQYNISLTNNEEFNYFLVEDYALFEDGAANVDFASIANWEMKAIFINSTNTITTVEEMENAIAAIFWWRVDTGVDFPIMYDEPYFEPLFPGFCTIETTRLY